MIKAIIRKQSDGTVWFYNRGLFQWYEIFIGQADRNCLLPHGIPCNLVCLPAYGGSIFAAARDKHDDIRKRKEKHLMVLSRNGLRDRIMTYLSLQAQQKNTFSFDIPFTREEMAAYLCVNRSALSHELSLMQKEGLIDFRKNRFTLESCDR